MAKKTTNESPKFQRVKSYYERGLWTADMVKNAVGKWITQAERDAILGIANGEESEG